MDYLSPRRIRGDYSKRIGLLQERKHPLGFVILPLFTLELVPFQELILYYVPSVIGPSSARSPRTCRVWRMHREELEPLCVTRHLWL